MRDLRSYRTLRRIETEFERIDEASQEAHRLATEALKLGAMEKEREAQIALGAFSVNASFENIVSHYVLSEVTPALEKQFERLDDQEEGLLRLAAEYRPIQK